MIRIGIGGIGEPPKATNKFLPLDFFIVSLDFIKGRPLHGNKKHTLKHIIINENEV
jgi:hypothetical protein